MSVFSLILCTCCFYCSSVSIFRPRQTSKLALSSSGTACRVFDRSPAYYDSKMVEADFTNFLSQTESATETIFKYK